MSRAPQALLRVACPAFLLVSWLQSPLALAQGDFLRGNANGDGKVDISDAVYSLSFLFLGGPAPACADAADANDDGKLDISDPVFTLAFLFLGGPEPRAPGPTTPGPDPTADPLTCGPEDAEPPEAAMNLAISPPSGANDNDPEITGTAEPGATVEVLAAGGGGGGGGEPGGCSGAPVASGVVEAGGTFRIAVHVADDTTTTFTVHVVDAAGNVSPCSEPLVYVEDSTAPGPPTITGTLPPSPSSQRSPQVLGTAEPNADIVLFLDAACAGAPAAVGEASAAGAFSLGVTVPAGATASITARAADAAGNQSACSAAVTYEHQAGAPASRLVFSQQPAPGSAVAGKPFRAGVAARDDACNLDPAFSGPVTLAIGQGPPGAVLSGTTSGDAQGGVFRTSDLALDTPGTYTLTAASPGLAGDETAAFVVREPSTPPEVVSLTRTGDTGCISIRYRLSHPQSLRADALIEFSPDADSPFQPTSPAAAEPVFHLVTAPVPGAIHRFTWNSSLDLAASTSNARIRVTPFLASDGTPGVPVTLEDVAVDLNRLTLLPGNALTSDGVSDIAAGDLNGDGRLDLASTNPSANTVTVHFQDSLVTGFFSTTRVVATGPQPVAVRSADFDRDGRQDLIVALETTGAIQVQRNDGMGGFASSTMGATGAGPTALEAGDVDGDGRPDAVTGNEADGTVTVLLQDGMGGFRPPATFVVGSGPVDVALADFDRDGSLDIVISNGGESSVSLLLQDSSNPGMFLPDQKTTLAMNPSGLDVADLDADGRVDVAAAIPGRDAIALLFGRDTLPLLGGQGGGGGAFVPAQEFQLPTGTAPKDVATGDLDADLSVDITAAGSTLSPQLQRPGDSRQFEDATDSAFNSPGIHLTTVIAADHNGNGVLDLVTGDQDGSRINPHDSRPSICLAPISLGRSTAAPGVTCLAQGQVDNDGASDIVTCSSARITVHLGLGDGRLRHGVYFEEGEETTAGLLSDVDGDSDLDLVWISPFSVYASLVDANSTFFETPVVSHPGGVAAAAGQFTADSHADLVIAGATDLAILAGNGAGGFTSVSTTAAALSSVATADFNGDGDLDVIGASPATGAYRVFSGDGTGNISPAFSLPAGANPGQVVVFDADDDDQDDVAGVNEGDGTVSVFIRGGDGTLAAAPGSPYAVGPAPRGIDAGDADGDQDPDLAITDVVLDRVITLHNNGDGSFVDSGVRVPTGDDPVAVVFVHLDGNHSQDLAVGGEDGITTVLARGMGLFADGPDPGTGTAAVHSAVGDVDGNGELDLITIDPAYVEAKVLLVIDGNRGITAQRSFAVGAGTTSVAIADVNGDGKLDVVVTKSVGSGRVYIGDGDGNFTPGPQFTEDLVGPTDIALGDINRDGIPDAVVANGGGNYVTSLLGNAGTFTFFANSGTGDQPASIALADFNRDDIPDLVAANTGSDTATISTGDGTGRFPLTITLVTPPDPTGVAAGNANGDAKVDLVVAHSQDQTSAHGMTFFPGADPPGTFGAPVGLVTPASPHSVIFLGQTIVGFDGDTLSLHQLSGTLFTTQVFVAGVTAASAPEFADPADANALVTMSVTPRGGGSSGGGGCAVGHFEHLGGIAVQRAASLLTLLLPFAALTALRLRERRRRSRERL